MQYLKAIRHSNEEGCCGGKSKSEEAVGRVSRARRGANATSSISGVKVSKQVRADEATKRTTTCSGSQRVQRSGSRFDTW